MQNVKFYQDVTRQESLKSVNFWQRYLKNKSGRFFAHSVYAKFDWNPSIKYRDIASRETDVNGQQLTAAGRTIAERTVGRPDVLYMYDPQTWCCVPTVVDRGVINVQCSLPSTFAAKLDVSTSLCVPDLCHCYCLQPSGLRS